jgi:hypothetical protein
MSVYAIAKEKNLQIEAPRRFLKNDFLNVAMDTNENVWNGCVFVSREVSDE